MKIRYWSWVCRETLKTRLLPARPHHSKEQVAEFYDVPPEELKTIGETDRVIGKEESGRLFGHIERTSE